MAAKTNKLLQGAVDIHVHCTPDVIPRAEDLTELAQAVSRTGMGGMVLKDHTTSTVGRVYALNKMYPNGPRFFSALALNPPTGLLNPAAVEAALRAGVDIIFFPTYGSRHHVLVWGAGKPPTAFPLPPGNYRGVTIFDEAGNLKPACETILNLIARYDAVLATGHLSPKESLALLALAQQCRVKRMVVTHASVSVTAMPVAQQQQAAALGALIEHSFFAVTQSCPNPVSLADIAGQIRQVGVGKVILSSDFGQVANGRVVEAFGHYLQKMGSLGFSEDESRAMVVQNPHKLLAGNHL